MLQHCILYIYVTMDCAWSVYATARRNTFLFLQKAPGQPSAVAVAIELSRRWDHIAYKMRGTTSGPIVLGLGDGRMSDVVPIAMRNYHIIANNSALESQSAAEFNA